MVAEQVRFLVSTGDHDEWGVSPDQLGSGLQSLLLLGLHRQRRFPDRPGLLLGLEEPESHLHPPLQHEVARELLGAGDESTTILLSTHSEVFVTEAKYGQTILVKQHQFYSPGESSDDRRSAINTYLMQGRAAELFFADSILLVEGPGDFRFFDTIRRRLALDHQIQQAQRLFCLEVGSNRSFGPWLRLLRSYGREGDRPMEWLLVCDGDSTSALPEALVASGQAVPQSARSALANLGATPWNDPSQRAVYASGATQEMLKAGLRSRLWGLDLEWELISKVSDSTLPKIARLVPEVSQTDRTAIARRFGSKVDTGTTSSSAEKDPWMRAAFGEAVGWADLSLPLQETLLQWLTPAVSSRQQARNILKKLASQ